MSNSFDSLCLSGGGIKGICYIGFLDYLQKNNFIDINKINNFIGTSVGGIIVFYLAIGYTIKEIKKFIFDFSFEKLKPEVSCDSLFECFGIDNGNKIIIVLTHFLKNKLNVCDITFYELFLKTNKKLSFIATNITKGIECIFNYETTPNLSVITALRMSISIPIVFTPIIYNDEFYVDGGLINNFPIKYCNANSTLGLYIKNTNDMNNINSIVNIAFLTMAIIADAITEKDIKSRSLNIVKIEPPIKDMTNFDLSIKKKLLLFNCGVETAKKYYENITINICKDILDEIIINI